VRGTEVAGGRVLFSFQHEQVVDSKQGLFWLIGRSFVILTAIRRIDEIRWVVSS